MCLLVIVSLGVYLARLSRRWLSISLFLVATPSSYLWRVCPVPINRSRRPPFLVLGCAAIAVVMTPHVKILAAICFVVGGVFFASCLRGRFTELPVRADAAFNGEIKSEGEREQETGNFAGFYAKLPVHQYVRADDQPGIRLLF